MFSHIIRFIAEFDGKKFEFNVENGSETSVCKKALFQFVGEIDKLEHDQNQKQAELISEEVQIEPIHEEA